MSAAANQTGIQSLAYIEQFYADYRRDPASVPPEWREYFSAATNGGDSDVRLGPSFSSRSLFNPAGAGTATPSRLELSIDPRTASLRERLHLMIRNYRVRGHVIAHINPLGFNRETPPELEL